MTKQLLVNGLGESVGNEPLATCHPLLMSGDVWYVNSATGSDAASPRGKNRERPLATLVQAMTNCASGDIIVLMDGHAESFSALAVNKSVTIVGSGSSSGKPTVKLTPSAAASLMAITAAQVTIKNVWFKESAVANTNKRLDVNTGGTLTIERCYFECGANDQAPAILVTGTLNGLRIENTTFISTATLATAQPESALKTSGSVTNVVLVGVVFSAGAVGFSNPYAVDMSSGAVSAMRAESISLLLGADMNLANLSSSYVNVQTCTGGSRVDW